MSAAEEIFDWKISDADYSGVTLQFGQVESIIQVVIDSLRDNNHEQNSLVAAVELLNRARHDLDSSMEVVA